MKDAEKKCDLELFLDIEGPKFSSKEKGYAHNYLFLQHLEL